MINCLFRVFTDNVLRQGAVHEAATARVLKLEDAGVIEGYTIKVDQAKLGYEVHAFITVFAHHMNHQPFHTFIKKQESYVQNNYKISGEGCYLLECKFPSNDLLDSFLKELNKYVNYKLSIVISK
nr:Lrp/AsnC family transcriptional regulator [Oceanobacillus alkalisoli]